jgi:hypothetical protein
MEVQHKKQTCDATVSNTVDVSRYTTETGLFI